jgi:hypothetical protein
MRTMRPRRSNQATTQETFTARHASNGCSVERWQRQRRCEIRTERGTFWRAALAGFAVVGAVPTLALLSASVDRDGSFTPAPGRDVSRHAAMVRAAPEPQPQSAAATAADLRSLRYARTTAAVQLRVAGRALRGCPPRPQVAVRRWRECVRWPLAHLAIDGRISGGMLYSIAGREGLGRCRALAMGEANTLRILRELTEELVRGLANSSSRALAETARSYASTRSLIGDLRRQLRRPIGACGKHS